LKNMSDTSRAASPQTGGKTVPKGYPPRKHPRKGTPRKGLSAKAIAKALKKGRKNVASKENRAKELHGGGIKRPHRFRPGTGKEMKFASDRRLRNRRVDHSTSFLNFTDLL
jgi:hypothetical protein